MQADVVILGAGPAGAIAALNLAAHCRVLLLDRLPEPAQRIGESLPPAARRLLTDMGLWQAFVAQGHAPCYGNRSIWNGERAEQDFLRDPDGHGWHLDRARFESWLRAEALARGAALLAPATLLSVTRIEGGWQLLVQTASGPVQVQARLLIDAGGRASTLGKKLGARRKRQDKLVCAWLYGHDQGETPTDGLSHIEAAEHGWWYSAALPGKRRVLAFHTDADLPPARNFKIDGWLANAAWQAPALAALLDRSEFTAEGPVQVAAAHSSELQPAAGDAWLAVGDAALGFDPLSSQGLFNALYTGLAGAEAGYRHLCGETAALADYRRQLADIAQAYRDHLKLYYREERRWPNAPFWQRRQG